MLSVWCIVGYCGMIFGSNGVLWNVFGAVLHCVVVVGCSGVVVLWCSVLLCGATCCTVLSVLWGGVGPGGVVLCCVVLRSQAGGRQCVHRCLLQPA